MGSNNTCFASISNEQIESSTDSDRNANLTNNSEARVSRMRSENTNVTRVYNTRKTSALQLGSTSSNAVGTPPGKPSRDSLMVKATRSTKAKIQSDRRITNERNSFGLQSDCSNAVGTSHDKSSTDSPMVKATRSTRISREQNSLGMQHGYTNAVRTSQTKSLTDSPIVKATGSIERKTQTSRTKSSMDSPMVKATGSIERKTQTSRTKSSTDSPMVKATGSGKEKIQSGQAQPRQTAQKKKDTAPPVKKSLTHTTSNSSQKTEKRQPSKSLSEQQSKQIAPEYHIKWEGCDEPCEPVGGICHLCEGDFSRLAYSLIEVSVLSCGHAFHSECLQQATSEEHCRDPPCVICLSLACY